MFTSSIYDYSNKNGSGKKLSGLYPFCYFFCMKKKDFSAYRFICCLICQELLYKNEKGLIILKKKVKI